ncbi:MAG TPA: hypothetical protein PLM33_01535 [Acidobacteriota bacterium]|jgi:hypothetical protein|nr:hypothetical protein [Acidobacteriota bacterium]
MTFERRVAQTFRLNEEAWLRHANPWSVWTRLTVLPLIILAVWSRAWIEWWSLIAVVLALTWTWINPRVFPIPKSTNNWASKGVLGEQIWLNRDRVAIPEQHRRLPTILGLVSAAGLIFVIWGVINLAIWPTLMGVSITYLAKLWFVDRMVRLYEDMQDRAAGPQAGPTR